MEKPSREDVTDAVRVLDAYYKDLEQMELRLHGIIGFLNTHRLTGTAASLRYADEDLDRFLKRIKSNRNKLGRVLTHSDI